MLIHLLAAFGIIFLLLIAMIASIFLLPPFLRWYHGSQADITERAQIVDYLRSIGETTLAEDIRRGHHLDQREHASA